MTLLATMIGCQRKLQCRLGLEGLVKFKGTVEKIIYNLIGGLKSSMGYLGAKTIKDLQKKGEFVKITKAGFYESMVHNVDHVIKNESQ